MDQSVTFRKRVYTKIRFNITILRLFFHFTNIAGCECKFHVGTLRGSFTRYKF